MKSAFLNSLLIAYMCSIAACDRVVENERVGDGTFEREAENDDPFSRPSSASHAHAPTASQLSIPDDEDEAFLESVLRDIFPDGTAGLPDEAIAIAIMQYISSALELKSNGGSATQVIKDGYAICGGMSNAFRILCRKVGIPARYIGSFNLRPVQGGHAISEVFYNGQWHLFDPTFGMFYYSRPLYDGEGHVPSFHEIVLNPEQWHPFKVVEKPWGGIYNAETRAFEPAPAQTDYLKEVYGRSIVDLYRKYATETFPVAYGMADLVSFPMDADLRTESEFRVGRTDENSRDIVLAALNGSTYVGSHYLGGASPPGFHTWLLKTPGRRRVRVTYVSAADNPPLLKFIALKDVRLSDYQAQDRMIVFDLLVIGPESIFSIYCPENTFSVDAIQALRMDPD